MTKASHFIVQLYLFLMLGIFPLYYQEGYFNMGDAKYEFFKYVTLGVLCALATALLGESILSRISKRDKTSDTLKAMISLQDITVLLYMVMGVLSFILSPYRANAWVGSHEWYMGLLSQLLFVGAYFVVTLYGKKNYYNLWVLAIGGAIVFVISYLHRFRIDPLRMYEGVSEQYWLSFLGTIGNANWYSSYICVILPIIIGIYIFGEKKQSVIAKLGDGLNAGLVFIGFATTVTQNSDSAYIGMALGMLLLMWFALEKPLFLIRFLEILLLGLSAAKVTGYLQIRFPEHAMQVSTISTEITKGKATWYVFGVVLILYIVVIIWKKHKEKKEEKDIVVWENAKHIRTIFYIVLGIAIFVIPLLMWMITTDIIIIETGILSKTGYLFFDDSWGNNRGKIWKYAIRIFNEYPLAMKLFGCGPDALMYYSGEFHQAEVQSLWGNVILTNVHNEWLNMLINYGFLGAGSYIAIFIVSIVRVIKHWKSNPLLLAFAASVIAYMGHNFFCFQQVVCTSLIFIVIGMAEYEISKDKEI